MPTFQLRRFRHRGLRVIHERVPGPLTAVALSIRAGARFDGSHPGIAHVAEHMLFQGTSSLDQLSLNRRAAELGGEHNADTGHEDIAITLEVFNSDLEDALALLAEQFYHTRIDPVRLRKERRIILDEIRGRLDDSVEYAYTKAWNRFFRGALAHPVCGTVKSVRQLQSMHLTRFIRRHFVHRNAVLSIAGGVPMSVARAAVSRTFRHDSGAPAPTAPPALPGSSGLLRLHRENGNQSFVVRMIDLPRTPHALIATGIALDLIGSDPDSDLFQAVREQHGLGYDVFTHLEWGPDWAVAILAASAGRRQGERLRRIIDDTCAGAAERGFSAEHLSRARTKLRYRYASLAENRLDRALAHAEGTLTNMPMPDETERIVARMPQASVEKAWRNALRRRSLVTVLGG